MLANKPSAQVSGFSIGLNEPNEDAFLALSLTDHLFILAVADGVGGSPKGEAASSAAIAVVREALSQEIATGFEELFSRVVDELDRVLGNVGSATTLTVAVCDGLTYRVGHVGDCRAYHLRGYGIRDITIDQNEGQVLIQQGVFSKRDIRKYPRRNVLTSALSAGRSYDLFQKEGRTQPGDRILIVSDGVYDVLQRQEIADLNRTASAVDDFVGSIQRRLVEKGLRDDASAVCLEFRIK